MAVSASSSAAKAGSVSAPKSSNAEASNRPAAATATAAAQVERPASSAGDEGGSSTGYQTLALGVSKQHQGTKQRLDDLAERLGCRTSVLIWAAIEALLRNPPTEAPAGAAPAVGSSPGFWVAPLMGPEGSGATGIEIIEVASRASAKGRAFFRYKVEDGDAEKTAAARTRAENQALKAARYDARMLGLNDKKISRRVVGSAVAAS